MMQRLCLFDAIMMQKWCLPAVPSS